MTVLKDQAICIGRYTYSDSSQIVILFGRDHGKIRAIAKGSRRPKSKCSGLDLLAQGDILFVPARGESNLATLTDFNLQEYFTPLRQDLLGLNCGLAGAELLAHFTEDADPHPELYEAFSQFLIMAGATPRPIIALVGFERDLLHYVGLLPVWDRCSRCGREAHQQTPVYFSSRSGGVVCRDCEPPLTEKRLVSRQAVQLLAEAVIPSDVLDKTVFEAHDLLGYHLRELQGKPLAAWQFATGLIMQKTRRHPARPSQRDDRAEGAPPR